MEDSEICPKCHRTFPILELIAHVDSCGGDSEDLEMARRLQAELDGEGASAPAPGGPAAGSTTSVVPGRLYHCPICNGDFPLEAMFILDECHHKFCKPCLVTAVGRSIRTEITCLCPLADCKAPLSVQDMTGRDLGRIVPVEALSAPIGSPPRSISSPDQPPPPLPCWGCPVTAAEPAAPQAARRPHGADAARRCAGCATPRGIPLLRAHGPSLILCSPTADLPHPPPDASRRLMKELQHIKEVSPTQKLGIDANPVDDNLYVWEIAITDFEATDPIAQDMRRLRAPAIVMQATFPPNYPNAPPFLRVLRPRFQFRTGHVTVGGSICMELLTAQGWTPSANMLSVLLSVRAAFIEGGARLDLAARGDYGEEEAIQAFHRLLQVHGWQ
ncbi:putative ubiquitinconjugating enzyme subfamily protein [Paratrimastix pyriformis]|uniref:Ubiquitinconjugating enzyme subfamily protein n=1 Tax=Paratrimastix pyriformis TaxID=342808 RepID=A0ABQ8U7I8_9EUKA|nr:putative ubiquitinconjugating enzyme subfamily protein [Paratrimastix pyriformis]